jgi:hypothetical protein
MMGNQRGSALLLVLLVMSTLLLLCVYTYEQADLLQGLARERRVHRERTNAQEEKLRTHIAQTIAQWRPDMGPQTITVDGASCRVSKQGQQFIISDWHIS